MKRIVLALFISMSLLACKNNNKSASNQEGLETLKGQFIFYGDAAVFQTASDIYGVFVTDKTLELAEQAKAFKKRPTDMVSVELKGKVTDQKDDKILWEKKLEIIEVVKVSEAKQDNNIITLGQ